MALVAFIKGINVGGHRTFRPTTLAKKLERFDVVNVGAAGTFVVRKPVSPSKLCAEIKRRLPFEVDVMICNGRDILRLASLEPFARQTTRSDIVKFVSVMARNRKLLSPLPLNLPSRDDWCVKILMCQTRFVLGLYRREMRTISYLGKLEEIFGAPLATRNWNTIMTIIRILDRKLQ